MTDKQRDLHAKAIKRFDELEKLIDQMKQAGPHPLDGWNALMNTKEQIEGLARRCAPIPQN
jgi:hypothetical protein